MSNQKTANEMFAGKLLRALYRDLDSPLAKQACNHLDKALRLQDITSFVDICSSLPRVVRQGQKPSVVRELLQVVSLIRFPIWDLDDDTIVEGQRARVQSLKMNLNPSDREIWKNAGLVFCEILRKVMADIRISDFKHGPGVVAETSDPLRKRMVCYLNPRVQRRFNHFLPDTIVPIFRLGNSKTVVVPKDHKTRRVIAAEPAWVQWCQQGVKGSLYRNIPKHRIFRGRVSFFDQELQRSYLRRERIATIDLSDASDTIKVQHLVILTESDLAVREFLMDLRTPMTLWRGKLLPTVGLFPMGAAVCFPIETLIFGLLSHFYSYAEVGAPDPNLGIFGDDIITSDFIAGGLCSFLERCGFKPNPTKTFIGGDFVESCGLMLYQHVDVTPTKIKKGSPSTHLDVSNITLHECSEALSLYPHLREAIRSEIKHEGIRSGKTRWNPTLQRLEVANLQLCVQSYQGSPFGYPEALIAGKCDIPISGHRVRTGWRPLI